MKIPGFVDGLAPEVYHSLGWLPEPALSSNGAALIIEECPRIYWHEYLNPEAEKEPNRAFDIGNACHLLALEPDRFAGCVAEVEYEDYRTKDARLCRDEARAAGKIPLLSAEITAVRAMREALFDDPVARHAFADAVAERSLVWRDKETGILCRARPDLMRRDHFRYFNDLKTSTTANPAKFNKQASELGYYQKAAWYLDGIEAVFGERPRSFYWIVVQKKAPHVVSVCEADPDDLDKMRDLNAEARRLFADCLARGLEKRDWPPYSSRAVRVSMTGWRRSEVDRRREDIAATRPARGMESLELAQAADTSPFA